MLNLTGAGKVLEIGGNYSDPGEPKEQPCPAQANDLLSYGQARVCT